MSRQAVILAFVGGVTVMAAQTATPSFEVVSIRQNTSGAGNFVMSWPKGSFSATNMELRMLIAQAYGIMGQFETRFRVVGGPAELLAERYDIQARLPERTPDGPHFEMLKSLLAERFNLRVHTEARPTPVYVLTFAREDRRLGSDLRASNIDCTAERRRAQQNSQPITTETAPRDAKGRPVCWSSPQPGTPGVQTLTNVGPFANLVRSLQAVADRPVIDESGLNGTFEWHLVFASGATPNPNVPSVFTAVQEHLGLKLEARTSPFDVLVIDSVERPTPD